LLPRDGDLSAWRIDVSGCALRMLDAPEVE
jgi:hypothetical protein